MKMLVLSLSFLTIGASVAVAEDSAIAALINNTSNPYWQAFYEGLEETSVEKNIPVDIYTLGEKTDAVAQLNQCKTALLKKPKALLFAAVNGMNLASCLRQANEQGTVLIDVDGNVNQELAEKMGVEVAFSVASNNEDLGKKAVEFVVGQSGKVLVLEGISGNEPSRLRIKGFTENLSENLNIIASLPADWDRLKANDITLQTLTAHPDISVIFAANDTMALGALEALRSRGKEDVTVVGIDGTKDAVTSIKEGRLSASIAQLPYLMAREAVIKADQHLNGEKEFDFNQHIPVLALDKETLEGKDAPLMQYLR